MTDAVDFACPRCTSRYKLVRVRAETERHNRLIHCKVCKEPLAPTDGEYVLKYFLVDKAEKHNGFDLRMKKLSPKDAGRRPG
jgi:transposase-like protein